MNSITEELYIKIKEDFAKGKSLRAIESEYGVNRKTVSVMLKKDNVHTDKSYSDEIVNKAVELYQKGYSIRKITIELGVDKNIIATTLERMGVRIKHDPKVIGDLFKSTPLTQEIARFYTDERMSVQSLADKYGKSTNYVWRILQKESVVDGSRVYRKYFFREDMFSVIDTDEKAYWLGFLYADGYVCHSEKHSIEITLKDSDRDHLLKFADFVGTDSPVAEKLVEINGKVITVYRIAIHSKQMAIDLKNHGCMQAKSMILKFPDFLSDKLLSHFVRGYFDGDGCLSISYTQRKLSNEPYKALHFGAVGNYDFLEAYESHLHSIGINKTKFQPTGQAFQSQHGGNLQAKIFFDYIYKDATVLLQRKYDKFTAVLTQKLQKSQDYESGMKRGGVKANKAS